MTGRKAFLLLSLGLVAAASVLLVLAMTSGGPVPEKGTGGDGGPPRVQTANSPVNPPRDSSLPESEGASPVPADLPPALIPADERYRGNGQVALRFVDALTGDPVPKLRFLVWSETGGDHLLCRGRSDGEGRAQLADCPADTILIQTERRPPHASTLDAVCLTEDGSVERDVRIGHGGTVRGRVVDERGEPVEGATILCNATRYSLEEGTNPEPVSVSVTGLDGRFRVDHLLSRPKGVWIVDGEPRPERWDPVSIRAERDGISSGESVHLDEGETQELRDLVLPRGTRLSGVVLQPDGSPAAGALVSTEQQRMSEWTRARMLGPGWKRSIPGAGGFELRSHEAVTGPDGTFEFVIAQKDYFWGAAAWAVVVLPDLDHGLFRIPEARPGETVRVEWRLEPAAMVRFRVKSEGSPGWLTGGDVADLFRQSQDVTLSAGRSNLLDALLRDGRRLSAEPFPVGEEWMARFEGVQAPDLVELTLRLAFHRPSTPATDRGLDDGPPLVFVVERKVRWPLHLLVRLAGAEEGVERRYILTACLSPEPGRGFRDCCGLGNRKRVTVAAGDDVAADLVVEHEGPFWVKVWRGFDFLASFGPFATGEETHQVAIADPDAASRPGKPVEPEPPPPSRPGEAGEEGIKVLGRIHARLVHAKTREVIEERPSEEVIAKPERGYMTMQRFDGREHIFRAVAGSWTFRLWMSGYEPTSPLTVVVPPDGDVDLGEVPLEPLPRLRLRIVEHDGRPLPLPNAVYVVHGSAPRDTRYFGNVGQDGIEVAEPPPPPVVLVVQEYLSRGLYSRAQAIEVEYASLEEEKTVRLRRWREVTVTVHGIAPDHADLRVDVMVHHDGAPPDGTYAGNYGGHALPAADVTGMRTLHLDLAPGTHRLELESVFYSGSTQIMVRDTGNLQSFEIRAAPR